MNCFSCRTKTTMDRCPKPCLDGFLFCLRHSKQKDPRNWIQVNGYLSKVIKIQAWWKGSSIRHWIKLAGPGALNRSVCHNDEELFTFDGKKSVTPLKYFSFVENQKVWWFDIRTIWEQSLLKNIPSNPYTREPLSIEIRQRLRRLSYLNLKRKFCMHHDEERKFTKEEVLDRTWLQINQIIEEAGFYEVDPTLFKSMNRPQLYIFVGMLFQDLKAWCAEHLSPHSRRYKYLVWGRITLNQFNSAIDQQQYSFLVSRYLLAMLSDCLDNYQICFMIMSAFYRL